MSDSWSEGTDGFQVVVEDLGTFIQDNVKQLYMPPLIGEPWVERVMDFSTQWQSGSLIGVTLFENEPNGTYKGTFAGDVEPWALEEHLAVAKPLVEKIKHLGGVLILCTKWQKCHCY